MSSVSGVLIGMRVRTLAAFVVSAGLAVASVISIYADDAQQFVLSSQDRAKLIAVDFAAVGADGRPVTDLRPDEVTLRIDGRTRTIQALEYVPAVPITSLGGTGIALPYGSNVATASGRSIVLAVDFETIRPGREAALKEHISQFVKTLQPSDRIALVTVPYGGVKVDLTTDHARVAQSISMLSGQASTGAEAGCLARDTLVSLRGMLNDLRGGDGPVTVIFVSGGMVGPQGVISMQSGVSLGRCQLVRENFQQVGAAVANARAQVYIVQPDLSQAGSNVAGLEHLTGVTGAPLWHLSGVNDSALSRVVRETSGYYLARFFPEPDESQGSVRGLDVSVSRPDVVLRTRPQMTVERQQTRFTASAPAAPLAMMKELQVFRDLPMRVTGFTSREAGRDDVRVVVLFDSPDPSAALNDAMVGLFAEGGRMVASRVLKADELQGNPVITALTVPAGTYRVRVAAAEASGRGGTADFTMDAGLAVAGSLQLSDLVLGLSRNGQFQPRLEFGSEASAMAHLEIYGGREGIQVGVMFEVARTANGPALLTMPGAFAATTEADRFLVTAAIPIGALPTGDYVVRATVAAENQAGGRVVRPLRKVTR